MTYNIQIQGERRLKAPVSLFHGCVGKDITSKKITTLEEVWSLMRNPTKELQEFTQRLRTAKKDAPHLYKKMKEGTIDGEEIGCPAFIIGEFPERKDKACTMYVPLLGFDIDGIQGEDILAINQEKCKESPYIFAAYPSPSGLGMRIFVWANSTQSTHKANYQAICDHLSQVLEIPTDKDLRKEWKGLGYDNQKINSLLKESEHIDTGTNNLARLWFYTAVDSNNFYLNENSQVFVKKDKKKTQRPPAEKKLNGNKPPISEEEKIKLCLDKVNRQNLSGRNNFIYAFASELCRHGLSQERALSECLGYEEPGGADPFPEAEIKKTVDSAFKSHKPEYTDDQIRRYLKKTKGQDLPTNQRPDSSKTGTKDGKGETVKPKFVQIKEYLNDQYQFRMNIISHEIEVKKNDKNQWQELNENDLICELLEKGFKAVETPLLALLKSSFVSKHDPFKEYVRNLSPWKEGDPDYIKELADYVNAKDQYWFNSQFKKMLVRTLACALGKIPFNKHCFVLKGGQNDGKSTFLRFLCPPSLRDYITDHIDIYTKDGRLALCQNFFINLDELSQFSRSDIKKAKALFTTDKVKDRLPYDRKPTNHLRRASFLASTNEDEFLIDETGNVRWLVFETDGIDHDHGGRNGYQANIDIDKVYAQAYALLLNGFRYELSKEEIAKSEQNNKGYQIATIEMELIQEQFIPAEKDEEGSEFMTATDILKIIEVETKGRTTKVGVGKAMGVLGYERTQLYFRDKKSQRYGYYVLRKQKEEV